ncbi:hypothetical protein R6Q57_028730 [Mikania cordata]
MMAIIGEDTPWSRLFEITYAPQYRIITVEFLSTFRYRHQAPDFQPQPGQPQQAEISFRLCGFPYHLSLAKFGSVLGLYTEEETHMPIYTKAIHTADDAVVSAWWLRIGDESFVRSARVTPHLAAGADAAAAPAHTAAGANAAVARAQTAATRAQSAARSYQRAADTTYGSVEGFDLVAGAYRA